MKKPESVLRTEESSLGTPGDVSDTSDGVIIPPDHSDSTPSSIITANIINSSTCDFFSHNKGISLFLYFNNHIN